MASALSKEMGMMEAQLKRWKDAAHEAVSLREKAHSLREELNMKVVVANWSDMICHFLFFPTHFVISPPKKFIS